MNIDINTPYEDIDIGGTVSTPASSLNYKTGDWRNKRPVFIPDLCKQCGLCFPVCPENAIPVGKDLKRVDFNYDYCKGCGICAKVCPFKAIIMEKEDQ